MFTKFNKITKKHFSLFIPNVKIMLGHVILQIFKVSLCDLKTINVTFVTEANNQLFWPLLVIQTNCKHTSVFLDPFVIIVKTFFNIIWFAFLFFLSVKNHSDQFRDWFRTKKKCRSLSQTFVCRGKAFDINIRSYIIISLFPCQSTIFW